jgi:hypothetical protein
VEEDYLPKNMRCVKRYARVREYWSPDQSGKGIRGTLTGLNGLTGLEGLETGLVSVGSALDSETDATRTEMNFESDKSVVNQVAKSIGLG